MNQLEKIQNEIELFFNFPKDYIWKHSRKREIVLYRHLFYYLRIKLLPNITYSQVTAYAKEKGFKTMHSTQIHSRKSIGDLIFWNAYSMRDNVDILTNKLDYLKDIPTKKMEIKKENSLRTITMTINRLENKLKIAKERKTAFELRMTAVG